MAAFEGYRIPSPGFQSAALGIAQLDRAAGGARDKHHGRSSLGVNDRAVEFCDGVAEIVTGATDMRDPNVHENGLGAEADGRQVFNFVPAHKGEQFCSDKVLEGAPVR